MPSIAIPSTESKEAARRALRTLGALSRQEARLRAARYHDPGMAFTEAFVSGMYSISIEPIVIPANQNHRSRRPR